MGLSAAEMWASGSSRSRSGHADMERDILRAAVDTAGALIMVQSGSGEIIYLNAACLKTAGCAAKRAVGHKPWELFGVPGQAAAVEAVFAGLNAGGKPAKYGYTWVDGNGTHHQINWTSTALADPSGTTRFVVTSGIDSTEQVTALDQANRQAQELGARIRELDCLHAISSLCELQGASIGAIIKRVVELVGSALDRGEKARIRIVLRGKDYASPDFMETHWRRDAAIRAANELVGNIELYRSGPLSRKPGEPPHGDEQQFLDAVAERLGRLVELRENEERLLRYQRQLRHLAAELSLAEERNRRRFARELQDRLGQLLALAKIKLSGRLAGGADEQLGEVLELLDTATQETRAITLELSPPVLEDLGFVPALDWLVAKFTSQHGIPATFSDDDQPKEIGRDLSVVLFQSVSELLNNAAKHSHAEQVTVAATRADGRVEIVVSDDGIGFNVKEATIRTRRGDGFGLFSIRERLGHFGGEMQVRSGYRQGTRIALIVPLESEFICPADGENDGSRAGSGGPLRVLLAGGHYVTRQGVRALLRDLDDVIVVGEADSSAGALRLATELAPDVVLLDLETPGMDGAESTRQIRAEQPGVRVVALSLHEEPHLIQEMLRAGATGYLLKDSVQDVLVQAIRAVNSDLTFFGKLIANSVLGDSAAGNPRGNAGSEELSPREQQILALMAEGLLNKDIARRCKISVKTVESHRKHIMEKLGLHSVAQLTKFAIREGMTPLDP